MQFQKILNPKLQLTFVFGGGGRNIFRTGGVDDCLDFVSFIKQPPLIFCALPFSVQVTSFAIFDNNSVAFNASKVNSISHRWL